MTSTFSYNNLRFLTTLSLQMELYLCALVLKQMKNKEVSGFSKWSKEEKIAWVAQTYFADPTQAEKTVKQYWNSDQELQKLHDDFIENTVSNLYLPLGLAPNFLINEKWYTVPMAVEESSVVAAAAKSAKYWAQRGGIKTEVLGTEKIGQVHFTFTGDSDQLSQWIAEITPEIYAQTDFITKNMRQRGGGITGIELRDKTQELANYYQLHLRFETGDAMGANFINSVLEQIATTVKTEFEQANLQGELEIVMSILSNYVPNCVVRASVSCPVSELAEKNLTDPEAFATKFVQAVRIAEVETFRAVTHNKGIMNGVDAVVLATGNDFRAIEAGVHAYAAKDGFYSSLSHAKIEEGIFTFWLDIPLALGTVGGLTKLHPLVNFNLELLGKPSAKELMQIMASAGLMQNFAALKSLTTTGIQAGHMKMHLNNLLLQVNATAAEAEAVRTHFKKNAISHAAVMEFIDQLRN